MSMTLAARASHVHHVSAHAPSRQRATMMTSHFAPLIWFRRKLRARPGTTLAHCVFAVAAGIILANALAFQRQDSPRSFIGEQAAAQLASQSRAGQAPAAIPVPPVRPTELAANPARSPAAPALAAPLQPATRQAGPAALPAPTPREQPVARDPIGDLIRSGHAAGGQAASDASRAATGVATLPRAAAETRPVMAAQRALNRVGLGPVKADGVFGEETRAALERFERDRRIPVTRDLSPRTLRELTAASGIRME
jgi:hypothetical protein